MKQTPHSIRHSVPRESRLEYLQYLPKGFSLDPRKKWPLILFMHGAGVRGDFVDKIRIYGIPRG